MHPERVPISPEERLPLLDTRRQAKMSTSAHAYVRGTTESFYEWLTTARRKALPQGPAIWVGGDCHVGNLGPIASIDGSVEIELRDLDQTVIGSPAHDVIRLALSMAMAVRASALPGAVTAHLVEAIARGYERVLEGCARGERSRCRRRRRRSPRCFARRRNGPPSSSWRNASAARSASFPSESVTGRSPTTSMPRFSAYFETEPARKLVTALARRPDDAEVKLLDAAYWVKGCSSLGLWRCAAVVQVGKGSKDDAGRHCAHRHQRSTRGARAEGSACAHAEAPGRARGHGRVEAIAEPR